MTERKEPAEQRVTGFRRGFRDQLGRELASAAVYALGCAIGLVLIELGRTGPIRRGEL